MSALEHMLFRLDSGFNGAILRIALGLAIPPVFRVISGEHDGIWISLLLFVGLLVVLRFGPAVLRRVLPFSREAKDAWRERRDIAKQYDSFQWQKLFWIGLGMLPYVIVDGASRSGELVLTAICLIGGCVGLFFWRRSRARGVGRGA